MLEWLTLPAGRLSEVQLAEVVANFRSSPAFGGDVAAVVERAGGPAVGWAVDVQARVGELRVKVRWLEDIDHGAREGIALAVTPNAVDAESGAAIGARLNEITVSTRDPFAALLALHAADLAAEPDTGDSPMNPETIIANAAAAVAKRQGISLAEATRRVRAAAKQPIGPRKPTTSPAIVPKLPAAGEVVDVRGALVHLAAHHPAWERMTHAQRVEAAGRLRDMCRDAPKLAQLSRPQSNGKGTVVLSLFPGASTFQRIKAYLAATVPNWDELPHHEQHGRALAARGDFNIIDSAAPSDAPPQPRPRATARLAGGAR